MIDVEVVVIVEVEEDIIVKVVAQVEVVEVAVEVEEEDEVRVAKVVQVEAVPVEVVIVNQKIKRTNVIHLKDIAVQVTMTREKINVIEMIVELVEIHIMNLIILVNVKVQQHFHLRFLY